MHNEHSGYLRTSEAAAYCGFSRQFFEIARVRGTGPAYCKISPGGAVRYRRSALDSWMKKHEREPGLVAEQDNHSVEENSDE